MVSPEFMGKNSVTLSRLEVRKLDFSKNSVELSLVYQINESIQNIEKTIKLNDSVMGWSVEAIKNIKDQLKTSTGLAPILGEKDGEIGEQEKLVKGVNKLMDSIVKLRKISDAQKYMKAFHSVNNSKISL